MPATGDKLGLSDVISPSGRAKTKNQKAAADRANAASDIAREIFADSGPLRQSLFGEQFPEAGPPGTLAAFLNTGQLPVALQADVPLQAYMQAQQTAQRDPIEQQFRVARENLVSRTPLQGGQLNSALADLEARRALAVSGLGAQTAQLAYQDALRVADQRSNLWGQALAAAMGSAPTAISGLLGSAGQFGNLAQMNLYEQLKRDEASQKEINSMVSMGMGGGGGKGK